MTGDPAVSLGPGEVPLILLPPRFEQWWATALAALFAGLGLMIVIRDVEALVGWLCLLFFGGGLLVVMGRSVFRRAFRLELHPDRFIAFHPRRVSSVRWADIEGFGVWGHGATTLVGWQLREDAERSGGVLERANRALSALDGTLPSLYGFTPEGLVALLEAWRLRDAPKGA